MWYKQLREGKGRKDKFNLEWREGIWLGHTRNSNEHIIGLPDGAVKAYSIKRQDAGVRWNADLVRALRGTPQQPDPSRPGLHIPIRVHFDPVPGGGGLSNPPGPGPDSRQIRRMKITPAMLAKYGYTDNCEGCRYKEAGFDDSRNHTEACRARIEKALDGDEHGRRYKAEQDLRINRRMAEEFEAAEKANENGELVQVSTPTGPGEGGVSAPPDPIDAESDGGDGP